LASFGAFIIPSILRVAIAEDRVSAIMFGFAAYYLFCFFLNFWFYLRPGTGASLEYNTHRHRYRHTHTCTHTHVLVGFRRAFPLHTRTLQTMSTCVHVYTQRERETRGKKYTHTHKTHVLLAAASLSRQVVLNVGSA
jgi:hypothetical protein